MKDTLQLQYSKGLFDSIENEDHIFQSYLTFREEYLLETYGTELKTSNGIYYVSDLDYSEREDIVKGLKKDGKADNVDHKYRMKLTTSEINFVHFD